MKLNIFVIYIIVILFIMFVKYTGPHYNLYLYIVMVFLLIKTR